LKSAGNCDFYADNAERMLQDEKYDTPFTSLSVYDPMGTVCNYALELSLLASIVLCSAGLWNVTLLKHAPNVIGCAKAIENAFWSWFSRRFNK
jgi:succinate-semialdehyde dehydrogenase/glutarate-semialdehyde dehydrogenase